MCKEIGIKLDNKHWYEHVPKLVVASRESKVNVLQNQQLQTDRIIPVNKPGTITHDNENRTCMLTLRLLMSYIYGTPSKARNANVVYIWTYVWQR